MRVGANLDGRYEMRLVFDEPRAIDYRQSVFVRLKGVSAEGGPAVPPKAGHAGGESLIPFRQDLANVMKLSPVSE